jgi:hypothetical protein
MLTEQKNVHMEHIEDLIFDEGVVGTRRAINFMQGMRDMLAGASTTKVNATVKWDGAPAIFAGTDPRNGKKFVAKKGIFNKDPKVYYTPADVKKDTAGDLQAKLLICLKYLPKILPDKGIFQGDLMWAGRNDLKLKNIDGQSMVTFQPNTIVYAVPAISPLSNDIRRAHMGIVWHTEYAGNTFDTLRASFGKNIAKKMKQSGPLGGDVWFDDATYKDVSGQGAMTAKETAAITKQLSAVGTQFRNVDAGVVNSIQANKDLLINIKTFNNTKIRAGQRITNPSQHVTQMFHYISDKYQKEIDAKKTPAGKKTWEAKKKEILSFFKNDKAKIVQIFKLMNLLVDAKQTLINKMNQIGSMKTFVRTANGYKVTGVEGFVAIDKMSGKAVKLVDRLEFSRLNFSPEILKGWNK